MTDYGQRSVIANGQSNASVRSELNTMTAELYSLSRSGTSRVVNVREFDIYPSATAPSPNTTAAQINTAYQTAITDGYSLAFDFEPGKYYWLETSILCFKEASGTFSKIDLPALIGNGGFQSSAGQQAVQFIATHSLPIVITQGGNGFKVENIWLRTFDKFAASGYAAATALQRFTDHTLWNSADLRHTQYSPSCCIAIDPFGSVVPGGQMYPGLESYYSLVEAYSSNVLIDSCVMFNNRVGVCIGLGVQSNTDMITLRDCIFSTLKYGVVTCHAQTQNCIVDRPSFSELWACIGNSVHGSLNGRWPGLVHPANTSYVANVYGGDGTTDGLIHPDWQLSFEGANTNWEDVGRIIYTSASAPERSNVSISNATFAFIYTGTPQIKTGRATKFTNCDFIMNTASQKIWIDNQCVDDCPAGWDSEHSAIVSGAQTEFDNCNFYVNSTGITTALDALSFGSLTTAKKNWFKFTNCKVRVDSAGTYYQHMLNCRGGSVT